MMIQILKSKGIRRILIVGIIFFVLLWQTFTVRQSKVQSEKEPEKPLPPPPKTFLSKKDHTDKTMQSKVKEMMKHAWDGYIKYCKGSDELKPGSITCHNWTTSGSLLFTPVDSLDTLYIMGLQDEYKVAKELVLGLNFDINEPVNHFETTIRALGGLLSAYDLDGDKRFLLKATDLGNRLLKGFNTPTGIPYQLVNLKTGTPIRGAVSIATAGTLQLEMQYLSDQTGDPKYKDAAFRTIEKIYSFSKKIPGLFPKGLDPDSGGFSGEGYGVAGEGDSFYEYLLKLYISTGDSIWRKRYDEASNAIVKHLLQISSTGKLYFFPDMYQTSHGNEFHHLSCFAGGMLGLGALTQRTHDWTYHLDIGRRVTDTCHEMYAQSKSGLGGESATVNGDKVSITSGEYILRPEIIESIFYYWRFSHDSKYRQWGRDMIDSLEKHAKTSSGYQGVYNTDVRGNDRMESFFLAETIKYLYLLFSDDSVLPLEEYVFNTEAHPLSVRGFGRRKHIRKP